MHVLIFAPTPGIAEEIQTALDDVAERYTMCVAWPDVLSCLKDGTLDLVLIERAALTQLEPAALLDLTKPSRWPTVILVDAPAAGARDGVVLAQRLAQAVFSLYQVGKLRIDTRKRRVELGERRVTLPPLQYRLLLTLAKQAGEVISYRELLRAVWGYDGDDNEARELLKVHIRQIRRRLRLDLEEHPYIHSVRGFGYMLTAPGED